MSFGIVGRLARRAGLRVFRIFARTLEQEPLERADVECRVLDRGEVLSLCHEASLSLDPAKVTAAYARGDFCAGAFDSGRLVGYCWFALASAPHLDRAWIEFARDVVYIYKSYVRPEFRGRGIAAALYCFADRRFLARGRRSALLCVETHNRASIAAAARCGFDPTGYAAYIGGRRLFAWSSRATAAYRLRFYVP